LQNPVHRFLFSLPVPLIATERQVLPQSPPARKSTADLAAEFQHLLDTGQAKNRADVARLVGCSRAWVTRVLEPELDPNREPI
jgi:hypothetical protein